MKLSDYWIKYDSKGLKTLNGGLAKLKAQYPVLDAERAHLGIAITYQGHELMVVEEIEVTDNKASILEAPILVVIELRLKAHLQQQQRFDAGRYHTAVLTMRHLSAFPQELPSIFPKA